MNTLRLRAARAALALAATAATMVPPGARADDRGDDDAHTGAAWWQWALSIPTAANPLTDLDGTNCMVGQRGKTWYLTGSLNGGSISRTCTIPEGVRLFFPVVNSFQSDSPGVCGQDGNSIGVAQLRANAAGFIDGITRRTVTLDSRPVRAVKRLRSAVFPLAFPKDNIINPFCGNSPVPAGIYPRSIDDGYYAEIDDLSVGTHMLKITATNGSGFDLDINYTLTVKARDKP